MKNFKQKVSETLHNIGKPYLRLTFYKTKSKPVLPFCRVTFLKNRHVDIFEDSLTNPEEYEILLHEFAVYSGEMLFDFKNYCMGNDWEDRAKKYGIIFPGDIS